MGEGRTGAGAQCGRSETFINKYSIATPPPLLLLLFCVFVLTFSESPGVERTRGMCQSPQIFSLSLFISALIDRFHYSLIGGNNKVLVLAPENLLDTDLALI